MNTKHSTTNQKTAESTQAQPAAHQSTTKRALKAVNPSARAATPTQKASPNISKGPTPKAVTKNTRSKTSANAKKPLGSNPKPKQVDSTPKAVTTAKKVEVNSSVAESSAVKTKKSKIIRDSFTMPKGEYQEIQTLKTKCAKLGIPAKKSELLRAGIKVLSLLSDSALEKAMGQIPLIKTGRPQKN